MPEKPETRLVKKIIAALKQRGAWAKKKHGTRYARGWPDILGCYKGEFFALEVKTPQNRAGMTDQQKKTLRDIKRAGGYVAEVRSVKEALAVLDRIDKEVVYISE